MLKQIKFGVLAICSVAILASCKNDDAREEAVNAVGGTQTTAEGQAAAVPTPPAPVMPEQNAAQPAPPTGPTTTMSFAETEFNFGKVKDGEKVRHEYVFTNTGKEPLVISDAKGSCGCTVPEWPKDPIPAGGKGKIKVEFDSKGKPGMQTKQVTITANTNPPQSILTIKGEVIGGAATPNVQVN
ncbi:MAG: hypothetical protein RI973_1175 [Bacteroidota bacterium]|jgi:hypothetical protein